MGVSLSMHTSTSCPAKTILILFHKQYRWSNSMHVSQKLSMALSIIIYIAMSSGPQSSCVVTVNQCSDGSCSSAPCAFGPAQESNPEALAGHVQLQLVASRLVCLSKCLSMPMPTHTPHYTHPTTPLPCHHPPSCPLPWTCVLYKHIPCSLSFWLCSLHKPMSM